MIIYNKIMVEPYIGKRSIRANTSTGFASIEQRSTILRLKVLADCEIFVNNNIVKIKKDQIVLISEELLYSQQRVLKKYNIKDKKEQFMLLDFNNIIGIE